MTESSWRSRLLALAERRLPALTRLRAVEPLPIVLHRRRIYVLPTGFGLFFMLLVACMALGALNYNNNPALMLVFLLASVAHTALLRGYLNLRGLRLLRIVAEPVHAGQPLQLRLLFDSAEPRARQALQVLREPQQEAFALPGVEPAAVVIQIPTLRRGWLKVGRIGLSTRHPMGLFRIWSWLHPEVAVMVYPQPEVAAPPLPGEGLRGQTRRDRQARDEVHSLRDYRVGDPLRLMAWKRSAQTGRAMVREFERPGGVDVVLDFDALTGVEREARIRRLTRWLLDAESEGLRSQLRLPGKVIGPDAGPGHLGTCLRELALLP